MSYLIYDKETTTKSSYHRKANPFDKDNWVVAQGYKHRNGQYEYRYFDKKELSDRKIPIKKDTKVIVGHNLKFDLLWSLRNKEVVDFFKRGGTIWCTQYAEYLLRGQIPSAQMVSMDDIVEKYGGELKVDEVKKLWESGVDTPDIDEDLLIRYLGGDINNTELIFLGQLALAKKRGMLTIIQARMDGLAATIEMEYNGLKIDMQQAMADKEMLVNELHKFGQKLEEAMPDNMPKELEFNWNSNIHKSAIIFGGTVKYEKWEQHKDEDGNLVYGKKTEKRLLDANGEPTSITIQQFEKLPPEKQQQVIDSGRVTVYQSGKNKGSVKTKNVTVPDYDKPKGAKKDQYFTFPGHVEGKEVWLSSLTDAMGGPIYKTNKDVIKALGNYDVDFLQALSLYGLISKDLGTYYITEDEKGNKTGMLTCVMDGGYIHHKLNVCITITSRMSSSDPNLQNTPRGDFNKVLNRPKSVVKRMFVSRFGDDGCMAEIDYSQLEVIVQAMLTRDPQLMQDVIDGVDFHCKRLSAKLKEDYNEVYEKCHNEDHPEHATYKILRTDIKDFTFQRAYGAGPPSIAAFTGMSEAEVLELMEVEERLYPGVAKMYDEIEAEANKTRWQTNIREPLPDKPQVHVQIGRGIWKSPTGTRFVFDEKPAPAYIRKREKKDTTFYRPHIQNYPIQGTGGEVVQIVLGKLWRMFVKTDNFNGQAFLVNTVHDCVWFDGNKEVMPKVIKLAEKVMTSVPKYYNELFPHMNVTVPFRVESEVGDNMLELTTPQKYFNQENA